ncbi:helix-turn-helix transcriptional regulator [Paenibacillus herberti]|nr:YafY family protein [Paenibacillus herberti]
MKLERMLGITMLLLGRRRVGAQELADRFEVSLRTIYRDLEALNTAGVPVISYPGLDGGYEIMESFRLDRQYLSLEELRSIIVALKGVQSVLSEQQVGTLLDKVGALLKRSGTAGIADEIGSRMIIDLNPWRGDDSQRAMLEQLSQSLEACTAVSIMYMDWQGKQSEREIEPIGLMMRDMTWYLYGYCRLRQDYRSFRLSRIDQLTVLSDCFKRHSMTIQELDRRWQEDEEYRIRLRLLFHPSVKTRVRDDYGPQAIETREDGWLLVECEGYKGYWLYSRLLSYGPYLRVLGPEEVAHEVLLQAASIVEQYSSLGHEVGSGSVFEAKA